MGFLWEDRLIPFLSNREGIFAAPIRNWGNRIKNKSLVVSLKIEFMKFYLKKELPVKGI
jgi:hypothetical protein